MYWLTKLFNFFENLQPRDKKETQLHEDDNTSARAEHTMKEKTHRNGSH